MAILLTSLRWAVFQMNFMRGNRNDDEDILKWIYMRTENWWLNGWHRQIKRRNKLKFTFGRIQRQHWKLKTKMKWWNYSELWTSSVWHVCFQNIFISSFFSCVLCSTLDKTIWFGFGFVLGCHFQCSMFNVHLFNFICLVWFCVLMLFHIFYNIICLSLLP